MCLDLERFFPAATGDIRKLFKKVIAIVPGVREQDEITGRILAYLDAAISEASDEKVMKGFAERAVSNHTKATEMQEDVDRQQKKVDRLKDHISTLPPSEKKHFREKVKVEKDALKALKDRQRQYMSNYTCYKHQFDDRKKLEEKLKKNREIVLEFQGW